MCVATQDRR